MEDYPRDRPEFDERFPNEAACREYLAQVRWPEGFRCPRCGSAQAWSTHRHLYHCRECGLQTSVTAGTILQDTKKPLRLWFLAVWHVTSQKQGVSALGLKRDLGLGSYRTAWTWLHKLRRAMVRPGRDRLSGTIEVDETYIGGKSSGIRGRGATGKALVVLAVELKGTQVGRLRLQRVPDASGPSLEAAVQAAVEGGSRIRTDGWVGYSGLRKLGYAHEVVRQTAVVGEDLLPHVHTIASLLKRWWIGTHQGAIRPSHLDYYLDEYTFRFNRRTSRSRGKLFYRLVQQAAAIDPLTADQLWPDTTET